MWTDNETDTDFLNFSGVATTVAEIITQAKGSPVSIGVSGAWGTGKSSMMRLIRKSLEDNDPEAKKYLYVEFNAWLYQGFDDAKSALIDYIAQELKAQAKADETVLKKVLSLAKRINWLRLIKLSTTIGALVGGFPVAALLNTPESFATAENARKAGEGAEKVQKAAAGILKPEEEISTPKEIQAIRSSFEEILTDLNVTLILLVDDLDRCLPETAISTLEAIRLFLFLRGTAFVIAADDEMIKHSVRKHFGSDVKEELVTNYFDKLVQIPIRVPPLGTQEVRAYMMLLFINDAIQDATRQEEIRKKVCEQLKNSWQGKRVDAAFIKSLSLGLSPDVEAKIEMAERLASIMVGNNKIAGNPRLIKRFLNAISIRQSIANQHGISINERELTKLLLLERCAPSKIYTELVKEVANNAGGKATYLAEQEKNAIEGKLEALRADFNDEFIVEWLKLEPAFSDRDLRGIMYISREHAALISPEDRLSSDGMEILAAFSANPGVADSFSQRVEALSRPDVQLIYDRLVEKARECAEWGVPPILTALIVLARVDTVVSDKLAIFLMDRPSSQIKPAIIARLKSEPWSKRIFEHWASNKDIKGPVKNAIQNLKDK
ncbi:MAG: hypothetical protein KF713_11295 [Turneriella sp.]|nr:hypothetical protein [Turneriella sp.]